jgi:hypothetical protein
MSERVNGVSKATDDDGTCRFFYYFEYIDRSNYEGLMFDTHQHTLTITPIALGTGSFRDPNRFYNLWQEAFTAYVEWCQKGRPLYELGAES